jgi:hypothetical protein
MSIGMSVCLKLIVINTAFADAVAFHAVPNNATNLTHLDIVRSRKATEPNLHYPMRLYGLNRDNFIITIIFNM